MRTNTTIETGEIDPVARIVNALQERGITRQSEIQAALESLASLIQTGAVGPGRSEALLALVNERAE